MADKPEPLVVLALLLGRFVYIETQNGRRHLVQVTELHYDRKMTGVAINSLEYPPKTRVSFLPWHIVEVIADQAEENKSFEAGEVQKQEVHQDSHPF